MSIRALLLLGALAMLGACTATPASRISKNRPLFDQYPPAVQEKIRAGKIEVGFTQDMVRFALGEPGHRMTRRTDFGETEIWIYVDNKPTVSFGIGIGTGGRHSGGGVGIATSTGARYPDERVRVEIRAGRVEAVEWSE